MIRLDGDLFFRLKDQALRIDRLWKDRDSTPSAKETLEEIALLELVIVKLKERLQIHLQVE
jgi:hypothetical protein